MKKSCLLFLVIIISICSVNAAAQTLSQIPQLVISPIEELNESASEASLGRMYKTVLETAINESYVFRNAEQVLSDYSVEAVKDSLNVEKDRKTFLLKGTVFQRGSHIQLDMRVYDVYTGRILLNRYFDMQNFLESRKQASVLVRNLENALFRDTLGSLEIYTEPSKCDIYLDGLYLGSTGSNSNVSLPSLFPGVYILEVQSFGYINVKKEVEIRRRTASNITINLTKEPGSLSVSSDPKSAEVFLDNKSVGNTPVTVPTLQSGEHSIRILKERYIPYEKVITIKSREEKSLNPVLEILPGNLRILSEPEGAEVIRSDEKIGVTPLSLHNLEPGEYLFELTYSKYKKATLSAQVEPGSDTEYTVDLKKKTVSLSFLTEPEGSTVSITEKGKKIKSIGTTPIRNYTLPLGTYTFSFQKENYFPESWSGNFSDSGSHTIDFSLKEKPGRLLIATNPGSAFLYLDDTYKGVSPLHIQNLSPGTYTITSKTAYGVESENVRVESDKATETELKTPKPSRTYIAAGIMTLMSIAFYLSVVE